MIEKQKSILLVFAAVKILFNQKLMPLKFIQKLMLSLFFLNKISWKQKSLLIIIAEHIVYKLVVESNSVNSVKVNLITINVIYFCMHNLQKNQ